MNEIFDKLIIRLCITIILCFNIILYRYLHAFFYPSKNKGIFTRYYPLNNAVDTIHFFSRVIGLGIISSVVEIHLEEGALFSVLDLFLNCSIRFSVYLISIYVVESMILYNFEYHNEVVKEGNYSYSIICFAIAVGMANTIKTIQIVSGDSFIILLFLWPFALLFTGIFSKFYKFLSQYSFDKSIIQKDIGQALSYAGFFLGINIIINSSLRENFIDIEKYAILIVLKLILSAIIYPLFNRGLHLIFMISLEEKGKKNKKQETTDKSSIGLGIYEGIIFFTACAFTSVIINNVIFINFNPFH